MQGSHGRSTWVGRLMGRFLGAPADPRRRARKGGPRVESLESREVPTALMDYANHLVAISKADINRAFNDVATIETIRPTVLAGAIYQDLAKIRNDAQHGSLVQVFADHAPLVRHLNQELALASTFNLPAYASLANYTAIRTDLKAIGGDYAATAILFRDLHAHAQTAAVPTTSPVSGLNQVYSDLSAMGRWGGMTPSQNPALQNLIQSIPQSAWSTDPSVIAINQTVDRMLQGV